MDRSSDIKAIDADGHIIERQDDVRRYLDSPWDRRNTSLYPGDQPWDSQLFDDIPLPVGYEPSMSPAAQVDVWTRALDDYDIEKAVLFPTGTHIAQKLQEPEFCVAVCRAANSLFSKEFTTDRLRPVGVLPIRDVKQAVREMQRGVEELGLIGFEISTTGLPFGMGDPYYDPLYEAARKLDTRILIHGTRHWGHEVGGQILRTFAEMHAYAFPAAMMLQFTSVMCQGVTERFPGVKIAFLEIGATWLPYYLDRLDEHWHKRRFDMPNLKRKPSEAFRDSTIKISIEADETLLPQTVEFAGAEHLFYATDIPHWDCEFPENLEQMRRTNTLSEDAKRKILYSNAKEFYQL